MQHAASDITRLVLALTQIGGIGPVRIKRALPILCAAHASGAAFDDQARQVLDALRVTAADQALNWAITVADDILAACTAADCGRLDRRRRLPAVAIGAQ